MFFLWRNSYIFDKHLPVFILICILLHELPDYVTFPVLTPFRFSKYFLTKCYFIYYYYYYKGILSVVLTGWCIPPACGINKKTLFVHYILPPADMRCVHFLLLVQYCVLPSVVFVVGVLYGHSVVCSSFGPESR